MSDLQLSVEYILISEYYRGKVAERSGVPYMNHIDEGIEILEEFGSDERTQRAFVLHPLVQGNADLIINFNDLALIDPYVVALAMEYRSVANAYLAKDYRDRRDLIRLSPLREVNEMLLADKIQNLKDFRIYHAYSHPRAAQLEGYFTNWITLLVDVLGYNIDIHEIGMPEEYDE